MSYFVSVNKGIYLDIVLISIIPMGIVVSVWSFVLFT